MCAQWQCSCNPLVSAKTQTDISMTTQVILCWSHLSVNASSFCGQEVGFQESLNKGRTILDFLMSCNDKTGKPHWTVVFVLVYKQTHGTCQLAVSRSKPIPPKWADGTAFLGIGFWILKGVHRSAEEFHLSKQVKWQMYNMIYLSKPTEITIPSMNPNTNCGPCTVIMCQHGFIGCDKYTTLVGMLTLQSCVLASKGTQELFDPSYRFSL